MELGEELGEEFVLKDWYLYIYNFFYNYKMNTINYKEV